MPDLYQVVCPKCHWNHFAVLNDAPEKETIPEVLCKDCEPIKEENEGTFHF